MQRPWDNVLKSYLHSHLCSTMKLLIDTSNRTQNPGLKSPVSFPQGSRPETPPGPETRAGQDR